MARAPHALSSAFHASSASWLNQVKRVLGLITENAIRRGVFHSVADAEATLTRERLDFVDIATTVSSHRFLVEMATKCGVAVICQKPFAPSMQDANAMVTACERAGVPLMVHENFRWQSAIQTLGAIVNNGEIGAPFWGRVSFRSAYDVFSGQPYLATGERFIIEDLGIHILDIARFLFGDVVSATARTRRVNPAILGEDVATILLDHESGVTSVVDCSCATHREPATSGRDNVKTLALVEAAYKSAKTGEIVSAGA